MKQEVLDSAIDGSPSTHECSWLVLRRYELWYNRFNLRAGGYSMAIRLLVKEVAQQQGMSMSKLQRKADVAYNTIKRIYRNPYYITTTETLGKLAKALGVPPAALSMPVHSRAD